jgi:hypothetical protein
MSTYLMADFGIYFYRFTAHRLLFYNRPNFQTKYVIPLSTVFSSMLQLCFLKIPRMMWISYRWNRRRCIPGHWSSQPCTNNMIRFQIICLPNISCIIKIKKLNLIFCSLVLVGLIKRVLSPQPALFALNEKFCFSPEKYKCIPWTYSFPCKCTAERILCHA